MTEIGTGSSGIPEVEEEEERVRGNSLNHRPRSSSTLKDPCEIDNCGLPSMRKC